MPPAAPAGPRHPPAFACAYVGSDPDSACVQVVGELDIATAPELELTLARAQSRARLVVLDLTDLAFIDGIGAHAIVNASVGARRTGRRLVRRRGPAQVERLLALAPAPAAEQLEIADPDPVAPGGRPALAGAGGDLVRPRE